MPCLSTLLLLLSTLSLLSQDLSGSKSAPAVPGSSTRHTSRSIYEDSEIKLKIPSTWRLATASPVGTKQYKAGVRVGVGSSVAQFTGSKVYLQKEGYTLALAYDTSHAGPGRFIEAFGIPWLNVMQAWSCSNFFTHIPQPANEELLFMNLVLRPTGGQLDKECRIKKGFGNSVKAGTGSYFGSERWFAGYFTSNDEYFFGSDGNSCGAKSYSLTTTATVPEQLPPPEDAKLHGIILEAIAIVNSIEYKRCAPSGPL